jgi:hypothetical protein
MAEAPAPPAPPPKERTSEPASTASFTQAEVDAAAKAFLASSGASGRALLTIGRLVLDVGGLLHEHPGGGAVLRRALARGGDAWAVFSAVGHSQAAALQARALAAGRLAGGE